METTAADNKNVAHDAGRNLKDQLSVIEYDSGKPYNSFAFIRADKWGREGVYQGFFASELKKDGTPSAVHRGTFIETYHGTGKYDSLNYTLSFPDREAAAAPIRAKIKWLNEQLAKNEKALAEIYYRPGQNERDEIRRELDTDTTPFEVAVTETENPYTRKPINQWTPADVAAAIVAGEYQQSPFGVFTAPAPLFSLA